jgi:hypothetical protein
MRDPGIVVGTRTAICLNLKGSARAACYKSCMRYQSSQSENSFESGCEAVRCEQIVKLASHRRIIVFDRDYPDVMSRAGSGQHLASDANIDAGLGFIWRISD